MKPPEPPKDKIIQSQNVTIDVILFVSFCLSIIGIFGTLIAIKCL